MSEINEWDKKIIARIEDRKKKLGEMQQNILILTAISLQFSKSIAQTDEDRLKREQKIKQFDDAIKAQQNIIDRYDNLDIPTLKENKSKAQAELAKVETQIESMKAIEKSISTPINTSDLDLSTLENQSTFTFKR